jgi:hypothetical protein
MKYGKKLRRRKELITKMFKTIKFLIIIIWLIDILNINFIINGTSVAYFLDRTIPLNFWFWLFLMLTMPNED